MYFFIHYESKIESHDRKSKSTILTGRKKEHILQINVLKKTLSRSFTKISPNFRKLVTQQTPYLPSFNSIQFVYINERKITNIVGYMRLYNIKTGNKFVMNLHF